VRPQVALVGNPVAASLSPSIQIAAFRAAGLDWDYRLVTIPEGELEANWRQLMQTFWGLNVTIPLKEAAARLVTTMSPAAELSGSVNTVLFRGPVAAGDSTDGRGLMMALARAEVARVDRAVVIGTGGAARAVVATLAGEGAEVTVLGRNPAAGDRMLQQMSRLPRGKVSFVPLRAPDLARLLAGSDLLVNATPLGGVTAPDESPLGPIPLPAHLTVVDLVYRPRRTPLLRQAAAAGCRTVEGIEMLVEQGALSFEVWTGMPAPVDMMRRAAYLALPAGEVP